MVIIGVDPGGNGAIALIRDATWELGAWVEDMPSVATTKSNGKTSNKVSAPMVAGVIRQLCKDADVRIGDEAECWVEAVSAMPGQGVTSMFSFGRSLGVVEGVVAGMGWPRLQMVSPAVWKRSMGITKDKGVARAKAAQLFPQLAGRLSRVKDDGRAEALLIAEYGLRAYRMGLHAAPK